MTNGLRRKSRSAAVDLSVEKAEKQVKGVVEERGNGLCSRTVRCCICFQCCRAEIGEVLSGEMVALLSNGVHVFLAASAERLQSVTRQMREKTDV